MAQRNINHSRQIKILYKEIERKNQELNKLNDLKNEFVSTVSHELRTPLAIIREATSQVLDESLGKVNQKQKRFLSISLDGIDRLGRIVDDLLDISKIEAGKLTIRRELVDIVKLARESQSHFLSQAKEKGLGLELRCSSEQTEVYVDKDRITQVFTNLLSNALKFTDQGCIEIILSANERFVECSVQDTGKGISQEDLRRVFSKFEQFNREFGPGEKGTGLGLAISKGIVEAHEGKIRAQSELGLGTKFTFTLPKFTPRQLFKEQITRNAKEAIRQGTVFSVVVFNIQSFEKLKKNIGSQRLDSILGSLECIVKQNLRRRADVALKDEKAIFLLLPDTGKENVLLVAKRMQQIMENHLTKQKLQEKIILEFKTAVFPEDGSNTQELLAELKIS